MPIQAPTAGHVREIAAGFGIALSEANAASFAGLLKGVAASYDRIDAMVEPKPEVKYARTTGTENAEVIETGIGTVRPSTSSG